MKGIRGMMSKLQENLKIDESGSGLAESDDLANPKNMKIYKDVLALSSGTLAKLTGKKKYDDIEKAQNSLASFVRKSKKSYSSWNDAWSDFSKGKNENLSEAVDEESWEEIQIALDDLGGDYSPYKDDRKKAIMWVRGEVDDDKQYIKQVMEKALKNSKVKLKVSSVKPQSTRYPDTMTQWEVQLKESTNLSEGGGGESRDPESVREMYPGKSNVWCEGYINGWSAERTGSSKGKMAEYGKSLPEFKSGFMMGVSDFKRRIDPDW